MFRLFEFSVDQCICSCTGHQHHVAKARIDHTKYNCTLHIPNSIFKNSKTFTKMKIIFMMNSSFKFSLKLKSYDNTFVSYLIRYSNEKIFKLTDSDDNFIEIKNGSSVTYQTIFLDINFETQFNETAVEIICYGNN
ncbi:hypothetical protein BpHYR1_049400 [Brachionus plicatilis]|uniref:Uncharacterized protein n=1 Tax=Brachionus plicatilis TaxID=10195 RepID=A0A3M7RDS7_BRAPC|nr:hypothetical protein BpHYR1_049400 [Brachionus plicatilis]